jgi:demethylmenaquinone methyltransferase/2-methoxy-6-polyprenyl-1,4-benzoquinol methylase
MFDAISNYDSLNRVISFGIDIKWRKKSGICKVKSGYYFIATGTGDLVLMTQTNATKIIGLDISAECLR